MNTNTGKHIRISEVSHVTVVPHNASIELAVGAGGLSPTHTRAAHLTPEQADLLAEELIVQAAAVRKKPAFVASPAAFAVDPVSGTHRAALEGET